MCVLLVRCGMIGSLVLQRNIPYFEDRREGLGVVLQLTNTTSTDSVLVVHHTRCYGCYPSTYTPSPPHTPIRTLFLPRNRPRRSQCSLTVSYLFPPPGMSARCADTVLNVRSTVFSYEYMQERRGRAYPKIAARSFFRFPFICSNQGRAAVNPHSILQRKAGELRRNHVRGQQ